MTFPKVWKDLPDQSTPIEAATLMDLEQRVYDQATTAAPTMTVDDPLAGPTVAFAVYATNPSGRRPRFQVENNQDTPEVDINIRNAVLNVGDPDVTASYVGAQINFLGPSGDTSVAWSVLLPGQTTSGTKSLMASRLGAITCQGWGQSSVFYKVLAGGEANDRFRILQGAGVVSGKQEGTGVALQFGDGGATALDTTLYRFATGVLVVHQVGAAGGIELSNSSTLGVVRSYDRGADVWRAMEVAGSTVDLKPSNTSKLKVDGTGVGFFGATPVAKPTLAAASTDLATVITLANDLRTRLINYGLGA